MKTFCLLAAIVFAGSVQAQEKPTLSVEKIMRDPKWIGNSPSNPFWSASGQLFFMWNPDKSPGDSLYYMEPGKSGINKADISTRQAIVPQNSLQFNHSNTAYVYAKNGDLFYVDTKSGRKKRITETVTGEIQPKFGFNDQKIVYQQNLNLYSWDPASGETRQLTQLVSGTDPASKGKEQLTPQEKWLKEDQLAEFSTLRKRKEKKELADSLQKKAKPKQLRTIYVEDKELNDLNISANGGYVSFILSRDAKNAKSTFVPSYVTESGFTEQILSRTKVGEPSGQQELFIFDRATDSVTRISTDSLAGITRQPEFRTDTTNKPTPKNLNFTDLLWAPSQSVALVDIRSIDNKDRWLMLLSGTTTKMTQLDHQHDSAWIGGPGIGGSYGGGNIGWIDDHQLWFQSEKTGYSHLYIYSLVTHTTRALTQGSYEVLSVRISGDHKYFYISTNEIHPGEQHFYKLTIGNGKKELLTTPIIASEPAVSPDEKRIAYLSSASNKPWELYLQDNKPEAKSAQLTFQAASEEFSAYPWREPELITFSARDGQTVYARLYQPTKPVVSRPAVIFVHGAGYLQNAHKWWSSYFREYMFHNFLADNGYTVLDIDYRASSGYGRNWRTGIYRFMGGKDLTDNIDGAKLLVEKYGINAKNIGIYGGSYGGFITLMAMFTTPDIFSAGAALRPVTDWAHYNHGYTSNILNEPFTDSLAYRRSSPIYHAAGLKGHLLICHGMIDTNVHYEDVVRLSQKLIELGKSNWELAGYPLEDHGFVEPSSWTDEYKRIYKLFETTLKQ